MKSEMIELQLELAEKKESYESLKTYFEEVSSFADQSIMIINSNKERVSKLKISQKKAVDELNQLK